MWKCIRCNKENQDSEEKCINCGHGKTMDYTGHRSVSRLRPEMTETWKKQKEKPMLMADCIGDDEENGTVFGSFILRNDIHRIEFIRITSPIPRGAWDVSEDRSGKIWAWVNKSGEENVLQIGSENGVYANPNCRNLFWRYKSVKEIAFNNLFDSSRVTDANGMFGECINLTALNLDGFQTENVRDMAFMFLSCKALTELNVSNFNTDNAQSMTGMFKLCEMLCDLDVSNFNTSRVTEMEGMFSTCESLTSLDVSGFDTGRVKSMRSMFYECSNLKIVDISRFNTESAKDMSFMFCKCKNLTELDVSHFKTDQVETMEAMFNACYNLRRLDVSGFDTRKATNMKNMFSFCENLTQLDTSNFRYAQNVNIQDMFTGCGVNQNTSKPVLMADCIGDDEENGTIFGSSILRNDIYRIEFIRIVSPIPGGAWDVSEDRSEKIWAWVSKTGEGDILRIGSENGVYANPNCRNLFWKYKNVREIVFNDLFDTSKVTDANGMFGNCIKLPVLNLR